MQARISIFGRRLALAVATIAAAAAHGEINLLGTCPAEDSSAGMRIVWHSDSPSCELSCGPVGKKAMPIKSAKTKTPVEYSGRTEYWQYKAELRGLKPGTQYAYTVREPGGASVSRTFRTAARDGVFDFLWMGDVHSTPKSPDKIKSVERLLAHAEAAAAKRGGLSFVLFTGDAVKHGQTYSCWKEWDRCRATREYMMAMVPGNKEYYRDEGKKRWHDKWFASARNNPENGAPGLAGTYWFLYGGVLFAGLDTLAKEGREMDEETRKSADKLQLAWLGQVVKSQKGRYRHLVVFQHYPYFKKSGPCSYGGYDFWREAFDRLGVDFALSGDEHAYVRTPPLRGGEKADAGTVYAVCPEIDSHMREPRLASGEGAVAVHDENSSSYGACLFSVDRNGMTMHYISPDGKICDSVCVKPKRRR